MSFQIACQTLPWSEHPLEVALEGIRAAGYEYMAFGTTHQGAEPIPLDATAAQVDAVGRRVRDAGLKAVMMFPPPIEPHADGGVGAWKVRLEHARRVEVPFVLGWGPWEYRNWPDEKWDSATWQGMTEPWFAAMAHIAEHAEGIGTTVVLKPHTGVTANATECKRTIRRIGSPAVRVCYDGGNVRFYEGLDPAEDIKLCAELVAALCVKDHVGARANPVFPCPGDGEVDHGAMLRTLAGYGFTGPAAVERFEGQYAKTEMSPELLRDLAARARRYLEGIAA
jgi:sugar phosphate isomerase/epimerase